MLAVTIWIACMDAPAALPARATPTIISSEAGVGSAHSEADQFAAFRPPEPAVLDPSRVRVVEVGQPQLQQISILATPRFPTLLGFEPPAAEDDPLARADSVDAGDIETDRPLTRQEVQPSGHAEDRIGSSVDDLELDRPRRKIEAGRADGQATAYKAVPGPGVEDRRRGGQHGHDRRGDAHQHRDGPWSRLAHLDPLTLLALAAATVIEASLLVLAIWLVLVMIDSASIVLVVLALAMSGIMLFAGAMLGAALLRIA